LRRSNTAGDSAWSVIITVNTTRKPKTSEDLIRAVNHKDLAKVDAILQGNIYLGMFTLDGLVFDTMFLMVMFLMVMFFMVMFLMIT
jgi:hypothetical protein